MKLKFLDKKIEKRFAIIISKHFFLNLEKKKKNVFNSFSSWFSCSTSSSSFNLLSARQSEKWYQIILQCWWHSFVKWHKNVIGSWCSCIIGCERAFYVIAENYGTDYKKYSYKKKYIKSWNFTIPPKNYIQNDSFAPLDVTTRWRPGTQLGMAGPGKPLGAQGPWLSCATLPAALAAAIASAVVRNIAIPPLPSPFWALLPHMKFYPLPRNFPQARRLGAVYCRTWGPFGRLGIYRGRKAKTILMKFSKF